MKFILQVRGYGKTYYERERRKKKMKDEIENRIDEITGIIVNTVKLKNKYMITTNDILMSIIVLNDKLINLQKENERLKDKIDWWKDRFFGQQEYDDSHRITAIEYKKRIEKANEYIYKQKKKMYKSRNKIALFILMKLENILQNGSDDNE